MHSLSLLSGLLFECLRCGLLARMCYYQILHCTLDSTKQRRETKLYSVSRDSCLLIYCVLAFCSLGFARKVARRFIAQKCRQGTQRHNFVSCFCLSGRILGMLLKALECFAFATLQICRNAEECVSDEKGVSATPPKLMSRLLQRMDRK